MNSNPLVSILMPVRNAASYLDECLSSIINQTEKHWELLAIDDHSADHSFDILQKYAANDHRFKVFKNNGKGIIPALRLAFEKSTGELISRMDADDIMQPQKIELLKKRLLTKGPGYVCTAFVEYFSSTELGDGYKKYQNWLNELTSKNLEGRSSPYYQNTTLYPIADLLQRTMAWEQEETAEAKLH
jgi:glycosyltransferase involved in cell wall biosynthesis